jgi:putative hemolysin
MDRNLELDDDSIRNLQVDVDAVLRKKAKNIYHLIPGFVINYLKRVVHQDEVNRIIPSLGNYEGLDFIEKVLIGELGITIDVLNPENIPGSGRYVVASNHPLGGLDGMALMHVIGKNRSDLQFIINDILMEIKPLASLFAPVVKHGRNNKEAVSLLDALYASDKLVLVFPAGLVSRRRHGLIADLDWKKSFITKAIQHKRDIVPVHIEGRNSDFFYNLANWRKRLKIKANIEMLYLADEMFNQRDKRILIQFGKPIPYQSLHKGFSHTEWAQKIREHVYRIPMGELSFDTNKEQPLADTI